MSSRKVFADLRLLELVPAEDDYFARLRFREDTLYKFAKEPVRCDKIPFPSKPCLFAFQRRACWRQCQQRLQTEKAGTLAC